MMVLCGVVQDKKNMSPNHDHDLLQAKGDVLLSQCNYSFEKPKGTFSNLLVSSLSN